MKQDKRRRQLFDAYAINLAYYRPDLRDVFLCPICESIFDRASLDSEDRPTIEHCVPETLGGRLVTLTCKRCNNRGGSDLDSHLERRLASDDFLAGLSDAPARVELQFGGVKVNGLASLRAGETTSLGFEIVERTSNPACLEAVERIFEAGGEDLEFGFTFHAMFVPRRARVAMMKAAYLLMFRQYGYGYVLSPNAAIVRGQIRNFEEAIIPDQAILEVFDDFPAMNRPTIVTSPADIRCYAVHMMLHSKNRTRQFCVALPGFDGDPAQLYERIALRGQAGGIKLTATAIDFHPRHLLDPARISPEWLWTETLRKADAGERPPT